MFFFLGRKKTRRRTVVVVVVVVVVLLLLLLLLVISPKGSEMVSALKEMRRISSFTAPILHFPFEDWSSIAGLCLFPVSSRPYSCLNMAMTGLARGELTCKVITIY